MSVEVLVGSVVAHGGAGVGVAGGDLDVAEVDAGVEHGGHIGVAEHVGVHPGHRDAGGCSQAPQSPCSRVARHSRPCPVPQDRAFYSAIGRTLDRPGDCGWEWQDGELVALAEHGQHAVAVDFGEVGDVGAGGYWGGIAPRVRQPLPGPAPLY